MEGVRAKSVSRPIQQPVNLPNTAANPSNRALHSEAVVLGEWKVQNGDGFTRPNCLALKLMK